MVGAHLQMRHFKYYLSICLNKNKKNKRSQQLTPIILYYRPAPVKKLELYKSSEQHSKWDWDAILSNTFTLGQ